MTANNTTAPIKLKVNFDTLMTPHIVALLNSTQIYGAVLILESEFYGKEINIE